MESNHSESEKVVASKTRAQPWNWVKDFKTPQ